MVPELKKVHVKRAEDSVMLFQILKKVKKIRQQFDEKKFTDENSPFRKKITVLYDFSEEIMLAKLERCDRKIDYEEKMAEKLRMRYGLKLNVKSLSPYSKIERSNSSSVSMRNASKSASSGNSPISIPSIPSNRAKSAHLLRSKSKSKSSNGLKMKETASINSLQNLLHDMKTAIDDTKIQLKKNEKSISKITK